MFGIVLQGNGRVGCRRGFWIGCWSLGGCRFQRWWSRLWVRRFCFRIHLSLFIILESIWSWSCSIIHSLIHFLICYRFSSSLLQKYWVSPIENLFCYEVSLEGGGSPWCHLKGLVLLGFFSFDRFCFVCLPYLEGSLFRISVKLKVVF